MGHPYLLRRTAKIRIFWVLGIGYWVLGVGCWVLVVGCWVLGVGYWLLGVGYWMLVVGYWLLDVGCWMLEGFLLLCKKLHAMKITIINGPNLNLLGRRETKIYGVQSFEDYLSKLREAFPGVSIDYFQSNVEGEIVDKLQEAGFSADGIVLNAAAYTHTSVAIGDAVAAIESPVIEVHISNVYARETYRHESRIGPHCKGVIAGFGLLGYRLALEAFKASSGE
jgi:3-dehydroquinate dehydratase II